MQTEKSGVSSNVISLPEGGGAMAGMGETFSADLFSGTGNYSIPIAVPKGRLGMEPQLSLGYSTGSGNGPCGLGWNMGLPGVSRKTSLGIPQYRETEDTFVLSGAEDLIPVEEGAFDDGDVLVQWKRYKPRTEGLFARISHITAPDGRDYWEVKTKDGKTSIYGNPDPEATDTCCIADPENPDHIFHWSIYKTFDLIGNEVVYGYEHLPAIQDKYPYSQIYLREIRYADYDDNGTKRYLCSVKLNYTDRPDHFSVYNSGFEIRTTQRIQNIETYTHPLNADLPEGYTPQTGGNNILVKRYKLTYRDQTPVGAIDNGVSLLVNVQVEGSGPEGTELMPPVAFGYTAFDGSTRELITLNESHLPALSLADPQMNLVDLNGNGLPDIVQMSPGLPIRYWKNRGRGKFDLPRTMKDGPLGLVPDLGAVQFMDADGDGRADIVLNTPTLKGFFPLRPDGQWDAKRYTPYKTSPTVNFASADVQFMDLTGDGRTDVIINGDKSFECYFQNSPLVSKPGQGSDQPAEPGWSELRRVQKGSTEEFPNVNFGDPRIRVADLSGDGLQDIVMISNGAVHYWPNLGYGKFGKRRTMKNAPRPGFNFDPDRVILADINGDGLADYLYINTNSVDYWINQSGNAWGEQRSIKGTPRFTSRNAISVVDLMGTGTPGLLWSYNAGESRDRMYFIDLTRGQKPYLLNEVDNNLGALTRVHYAPSTEFYLMDLYGESPTSFPYVQPVGPWKTTLPFPVLTVSKVEAIDRISENKLTTRYFYHHGYWDGVEREFRGFGRVDQFDTETFAAYNAEQLVLDENFEGVSSEEYVPPVYTKNWFHLGPVQKLDGEWGEVDYIAEYWTGDPNVLSRPAAFNAMLKTLTRRGRRDALRTLRGSALRSELFAKDGTPLRDRPYSVKETQTSAKFIDGPDENPVIKALGTALNSNCIFFPFQYASRETMWERGEEPKSTFSFTGEIDIYGQALESLSIAVPRGKNPLTGEALFPDNPHYNPAEPYRAVLNTTAYFYKVEAERYFVDRSIQARSEEITGTAAQNVFTIRENAFGDLATKVLLSHQLTYYDGAAYVGLPYGEMGSYGLPVRSESLVVTPGELTSIYGTQIPPAFSGSATPNWGTFPTAFVNALPDPRLGYTWHDGTGDYEEGYYATGDKLKYDVQDPTAPDKGLVMAMRNVYDNESQIEYDSYHVLPIRVTDPAGMEVLAENDYRLLAPWKMTDPNENVTKVAFNALGLVTKMALCGKDNGTEGDTLAVPGIRFEYDFFAFMNDSDPIWVRKIARENHINASYINTLPPAQQNATIETADYSDGYGRLVQSRAQAEDVIFGDQKFGDSGLPISQTSTNEPAVGIARSGGAPLNVVVSGQKRYNNKGEVVEQYEPYFSSGFDYEPEETPDGVAIKMYYDPLGRMVKTVNPDNSEQRVVFGISFELDTPGDYRPTPWERYHYSPNDLASLTNPSSGVPQSSWFTPKSETIDSLGNVIRTTEHKAHYTGTNYEDVVMTYEYDIKGQLIKAIDPYQRVISWNRYSTGGQMLRTDHIDRGTSRIVMDAMGLPVITDDAKGARSLMSYDILQRPTFIRARDTDAEAITLRQEMQYGDDSGQTDLQIKNLKGKLYIHKDEAGDLNYTDYDFKGNLLNFRRRVIDDTAVTAYAKYVVNWDNSIPLSTSFVTTSEYDALNRIRKSQYPLDLSGQRKELVPVYNKGGALESLKLGTTTYVAAIAYNARGQRLLMARGNGMMTRYAYDPNTFRLARTRSEKFTFANLTFTPNSGVQQDLIYTYDLEGTITSQRDLAPKTEAAQGPGDLLRTFTHDPLRRLLSATGRESSNVYDQPSWDLNIRPENRLATNDYTRSYEYDKIGNIQNLKHVAAGTSNQDFTRTYNYSPGFANNRLASFTIGSNNYPNTYDTNGNLTKEGSTRYLVWSHNDKPVVFYNRVGTATPTVFTHYFYNAQGDRVKKITRKNQMLEVTVYVDGGIFEESYLKPNGVDINTNFHFNTLYLKDGSSSLVSQRIGTNQADSTPAVKYNIEDHLGNSTVMLTTTGALINREEYYPFGETAFGGIKYKRYRFNGKEKDEDSGLYNYGQRYYAPWLCRFVSVDPVAEKYADLSSYNYAGNMPESKVDIEGLQQEGRQETSSSDSTSSYRNEHGEKQITYSQQIYEQNYVSDKVANIPSGEPVTKNLTEVETYQFALLRTLHPGAFRISDDQYIDQNLLDAEKNVLDVLTNDAFRYLSESVDQSEISKDFKQNLISALFGNFEGVSPEEAVGQFKRSSSTLYSFNWADAFSSLFGGQLGYKSTRAVPFGFKNMTQFKSAISSFKKAVGMQDAVYGIRGSSVAGKNTAGTKPFNGSSDFDFFVVSDELYNKGVASGISARAKSFAIWETPNVSPELFRVSQTLTKALGRTTSIRIFNTKAWDEIQKSPYLLSK